MDRISRLTSDQRANLVAYLDGELDDPAVQEIEQALAHNEIARREVDMLVRTWQLLDELPRPRASDDFARKTLTRIQVPAEPMRPAAPWTEWQPMIWRGLWTALAVAGLCAGASLGFMATNQWVPEESRMLVDELPVIERLEAYNDVRSLEFLQELRRSALFQEGSDANPP